VVVQALVLIGWWFWQVKEEAMWAPFGWANMAVQWAVALAFFLAINGWLAAHTRVVVPDADENPIISIP
jgi:hypothetical protein